jgi:hypothetical protein
MPGEPVEVSSIGYLICCATTCAKVSFVIPSSRACAKASSRLGPMVPREPASERTWQSSQVESRKSCLPFPWLPPST